MQLEKMEYLGDGVYCGHDGYQVWLTTGSHENEPLVALEPSVMKKLVSYAVSVFGDSVVKGVQ